MVTRVARNPIEIPSGVDCKIDGRVLIAKGKLGELQQDIHPFVAVNISDNAIQFSPSNGEKEANALTGTMAALAKNMVKGVSEGFECKLVLVGVGYRAKAQGNTLNLTLGLSHPVDMEMPKGISVETPSQTEVVLKGADKQAVFQMGAKIRAKRPPEPYKGKGIRYHNEQVVMKEAKKK